MSRQTPHALVGGSTEPHAVTPHDVAAGLPVPLDESEADQGHDAGVEADRRELRGAIAMVSQGFATRVVVCGLHDPEAALTSLITEAGSAGTSLHLDRRECGTAVEVRRL